MGKFVPPDPNNPQAVRYGVVLSVVPLDALYAIEIERAPDNGSGSPDTANAVSLGSGQYPESGGVFEDELPNDNTYRHYRARHVLSGGTAGAWSAWLRAKPDVLPTEFKPKRSTIYPVRRDKRLVDGKYTPKADDEAGELISAPVFQSDGVASLAIAKGYVRGTARNGDAITFPLAFQLPPAVILRGGIQYEPRSKWGATGSGSETNAVDANKPQYDDLAPLNLSASGFTLRARLRQKAAQTAQSDNFTASNVLDAVGETAEANLDPAGAVADTYNVHYSAEVTVPAGKAMLSGSITVAIDTNDGAGWVERAAQTHTVINEGGGSPATETWSHVNIAVVVSGLGLNDDIRVRIKSATGTVSSFSVHAFDGTGDPSDGVTYSTASDSFASKTPDTEDAIEWEVLAVAA